MKYLTLTLLFLVGCSTIPSIKIPESEYAEMQFKLRDLERENTKLLGELIQERGENFAMREKLREIEHPFTAAEEWKLKACPVQAAQE